MHAAAFDRDVVVSQLFRGGLSGAKYVCRARNWPMIIFVMLIIPLTNAAAVSGLVSSVKIPGFIMDLIEEKRQALEEPVEFARSGMKPKTKAILTVMEEDRVDVMLTDDRVMVRQTMNYDYMHNGAGKIVGSFFK